MDRILEGASVSSAHRWLGVLGLLLCVHATSFAQPDRIAQRIETGPRFALRGTLHPLAASKFDQGRADASMQLDRLTLVLKPSTAPSAGLDRFVAAAQLTVTNVARARNAIPVSGTVEQVERAPYKSRSAIAPAQDTTWSPDSGRWMPSRSSSRGQTRR